MSQSNDDTARDKGHNAISTSNDTNGEHNKNGPIATSSPKDDPKQPKKKKPIQHLLAGGTAGFVESSVCHPLDTIKTRMQLRRQNTARIRSRGRALGSMRDADGRGSTGDADGFKGRDHPPRALHRTMAGEGKDAAEAAARDGRKGGGGATKHDTVRVRPDASAKAEPSTKPRTGALHDVGWKQRLPPAAAAEGAAASAAKVATASSPSSSSGGSVIVAPLGPFGTARRIIQREGPLALYKGLTAVYTGIVPKMAIRFVSFEYYRDNINGWYGGYTGATAGQAPPPGVTFVAGLLSGLTEAVAIVTPAEVCKIRMQSQYHSLMDPKQGAHSKYKNVAQTAMLVAREEGLGALYKGVVPTMLRQGCNQAVNFTVYNYSKKRIIAWKRKREEDRGNAAVGDVQLDHWQSLLLGGLSGGMGPLVNNPLDVVKTRMQKQVIHTGKEPKVHMHP